MTRADMLPAIPFPFIYGLAEFRLLLGWQSSGH